MMKFLKGIYSRIEVLFILFFMLVSYTVVYVLAIAVFPFVVLSSLLSEDRFSNMVERFIKMLPEKI